MSKKKASTDLVREELKNLREKMSRMETRLNVAYDCAWKRFEDGSVEEDPYVKWMEEA